mmetsp:Transcript_2116/g.5206  ORF Transcript_2116/g.5206 Transcript_2116/m.5206 type:complete len:209 (+) Transcript_2116:277-903(+)
MVCKVDGQDLAVARTHRQAIPTGRKLQGGHAALSQVHVELGGGNSEIEVLAPGVATRSFAAPAQRPQRAEVPADQAAHVGARQKSATRPMHCEDSVLQGRHWKGTPARRSAQVPQPHLPVRASRRQHLLTSHVGGQKPCAGHVCVVPASTQLRTPGQVPRDGTAISGCRACDVSPQWMELDVVDLAHVPTERLNIHRITRCPEPSHRI